PSRSAAACKVDTQDSDSPHTSATFLPPPTARRTAVIAKFRTTTSDSAYSASTAEPTITRHRPPARSRCRSQGAGMPSSIARVTARMPAPYHGFNNCAAQRPRKTPRSPGLRLTRFRRSGPRVHHLDHELDDVPRRTELTV